MENDWRVCTKLRLACWNINRFVTLLVSELIHAKLRRKQLGVGWEAPRCVRGCSECWAGMVSALWHAYWQLDSHLLGKLAASTDYRTTIVEHVLHLLHWAYEGHLAFNSASLQSITDKWSTRMCGWWQGPQQKACRELWMDRETWGKETVGLMDMHLGIHSWCPAVPAVWRVVFEQILMTLKLKCPNSSVPLSQLSVKETRKQCKVDLLWVNVQEIPCSVVPHSTGISLELRAVSQGGIVLPWLRLALIVYQNRPLSESQWEKMQRNVMHQSKRCPCSYAGPGIA